MPHSKSDEPRSVSSRALPEKPQPVIAEPACSHHMLRAPACQRRTGDAVNAICSRRMLHGSQLAHHVADPLLGFKHRDALVPEEARGIVHQVLERDEHKVALPQLRMRKL